VTDWNAQGCDVSSYMEATIPIAAALAALTAIAGCHVRTGKVTAPEEPHSSRADNPVHLIASVDRPEGSYRPGEHITISLRLSNNTDEPAHVGYVWPVYTTMQIRPAGAAIQ
jgi:hypothetical protein